MKKVTTGRDYLGQFAPEFARINDDVLFGEVWSREAYLSPKLRSMITISALLGAGMIDQSLQGHLQIGKENGISQSEIVEIITQLAFYTGWPKAWAAFSMATEVWKEDDKTNSLFGKGELLNDHEHFTGNVYVKEIFGFNKPMLIDNVTFAPGARNHWHIHQVGQTLLVTEGKGWYQEEGKKPILCQAGDIIEIPAGIKHFHGACQDSWFVHLAIEDPSKGAPTWLEKVSDKDYEKLEEKAC